MLLRGEGYTRDLSPAGVFVITTQTLAVGTAVRLAVDLPGLQRENSGPRLKTQAHVIRAERGGFAAIADAGFRLQIQGSDSGRKSTKESSGTEAVRRVELQHQ